MKRVLLWVWQAPQNIVGLFLVLVLHARKEKNEGIVYYDGKLSGGVSLGDYIIIDRRYYKDDDTIRHEHGHQIQSRRWGWFYLLTVGLVSASRNLYDRIAHRSWTSQARLDWYYGSWPERQADILGGVQSRRHP